MKHKKLTDGLEGLVIIALGALFFGLALSVKTNPVAQKVAWVNILAQAKFFPLVCAAAIIILGIILFVSQMKGKKVSGKLSKSEWKRAGIVTAIVTVYILLVYFINFTIPTILYTFGMLFYLNWGKKKIWVLAIISVIYIAVCLFVLPKVIQLRLP